MNAWVTCGPLSADNPMTEIVDELKPTDADTVVIKQYASAFFGTSLAAMLTAQGVDTIILIGCSTSGCVRATALGRCESMHQKQR